MNKALLVMLMAGSLTACLEGGNSSPTEHEDDTPPSAPTPAPLSLEEAGVLPVMDRSGDLAGPDSNTDGIRDDIEAYIEQAYPNQTHQAAARQAARAMQEIFSLDLDDPIEVKEANRDLARADHCLFVAFEEGNTVKPAAEVSRELEAMATNTKARLRWYLDFNKALDGTSWTTPKGNTCE